MWNLRPALEEEKTVFLIGDEISRYPIDFKRRFGIDYSQYPVRPLGVREINRKIWLSQLNGHNGVFFFCEVLDGHPNLINGPVRMMDKVEELCGRFHVFDRYIAGAAGWAGGGLAAGEEAGRLSVSKGEFAETYAGKTLESLYNNRVKTGRGMLQGLRFVSEEGHLLRMMPMLELDPALPERPLYHWGMDYGSILADGPVRGGQDHPGEAVV